MNTTRKTAVLLGALSAVILISMAPILAAEAKSSDEGKDHPCRTLRKAAIQACGSAKFEKGKHQEHKGLFKDCVRPIMEGKPVEGVSVDPTLVQACQARKSSHPKAGGDAH